MSGTVVITIVSLALLIFLGGSILIFVLITREPTSSSNDIHQDQAKNEEGETSSNETNSQSSSQI